MMTSFRRWSLGCVISGVLLSAISVQAQDAEGVVRLGGGESSGVIRISDQRQAGPVFRGQSEESDLALPPELLQAHCQNETNCPSESTVCPEGYVTECPQQCGRHCGMKATWSNWYHGGGHDVVWFNGKCARKHSGPGRPLAGCYNMVYPVDPGYFDRRDGQVYAAPGYGGPVSVPLAPVVNSTYNYGWGIPSSRLTPVQHPVTQAPISRIPSPYPTAPVSY